jgi:anti-sigma B factor antagonist
MDVEMKDTVLGGKQVVLALAGRVTTVSVGEIRAKMKSLVADGKGEMILDLSRVTFLDSSGLAALVSGLKTTREAGGWLRLAGVSDNVRSVFTLTMLDRVFQLYPDLDSARK